MNGLGSRVAMFLAVCTLLAAPAVVRAGTITVFPDQLTQSDSATLIEKSPKTLIAEGGHFYKLLNLPVGAVVDRFRVSFTADQPGYDFCVTVSRVRLGVPSDDLIIFGRNDPGLPPYPALPFTTIEGWEGPRQNLKVLAGYRYFLHVDPDNSGGQIHSVQVIYK
jgi:hypothetical protein